MTEPRSTPNGPSAATRAAIRAAVETELVPVRSRPLSGRVFVVIVAALGAAGLVASMVRMMKPRGEALHGHAALAGAVAIVTAALLIAGSFAPVVRWRLGTAAKLLLIAGLVAGSLAYLAAIASTGDLNGAVHRAALVCGALSLVAGLLTCGAAVWVFRGADPWTPRLTGALLGAAAGGVATAGVGLGCGSLDLGHLLVGHGLVVPFLAVAGALAAHRALRP